MGVWSKMGIRKRGIWQSMDEEKRTSRLKPLNDFIFQKLMGERGSEDELKSFLGAVLGKKLKKITILENKTLTPEIIGDKKSILDVRATTDDDTHINVEVQINPYSAMDVRSLFYWSKLYGSALGEGEDYKQLPKTIMINILDFDYDYIKIKKRYHTKFHMWEDDERYKLTDAIEIHFIEMRKFRDLELKDIKNNILHRWLTFFDEQTDEKIIKELMNMDRAIRKANDKLKYLSQDKEFLRQANLRAIALSDYTTSMNNAKAAGKAEERAEAKAEKLESVKRLIEMGLTDSQISKAMKIPEKDVADLRN